MTNLQKPEARAKGDGQTLDLHSMFFTIQGEGPFAGHRSIFVRLAGCNLRCPGCDTEYTQGRSEVSMLTIAGATWDLAKMNNAERCLVVITGGEPLRQTIGPFVEKLLSLGFKVQIESNGVFAPDHWLDMLLGMRKEKLDLVVSPKTKHIDHRTAQLASCFKYVLDASSVDPEDGLPIMALEHPASTGVARPPRVPFPGGKSMLAVRVYVNPYDAKDEAQNALNLTAVAKSCMKHGYIAGVQMHKYMNLE